MMICAKWKENIIKIQKIFGCVPGEEEACFTDTFRAIILVLISLI